MRERDLALRSAERDERSAVRAWQRPEEISVDHAVHRARDPNAEREGDRDGGAQPRIAREPAERDANLAREPRTQPSAARNRRVPLVHLAQRTPSAIEISELAKRLRSCGRGLESSIT